MGSEFMAATLIAWLLRGLAAANDPLAVTFRHVNPSLGVTVELLAAAAGIISCRRTIVLSRLRDSVTFLRLERRRWSRLLRLQQKGGGGRQGERGYEQVVLFHSHLL